MRERIVEFMDIIVDFLKAAIEVVMNFSMLILYLLIIGVIIILTPLWVIPYLIFRKKP